MLVISNAVSIPDDELEFTAMRAQGAGGQHVNRTESAVQLRFNYRRSPSLPDFYKERLAGYSDGRITQDGDILIKSQEHRSQLRNKEEALERLRALILDATRVQKVRRPTKPTRASQKRRVEGKKSRAKIKAGRGKVKFD
ncbi:alternative ribosome rescue aminoacyl-tRNA hydrolase ArfB [Gallaecimonas sp. GXIMD4217]|uniref:alternative ribosome rescue aminoacyl-tRNA hydrolase ArfB n=1 Tax=Gallaecimonas sp. GXIMD4217 TaxID=3131927 RepID=UPI00311B43C0